MKVMGAGLSLSSGRQNASERWAMSSPDVQSMKTLRWNELRYGWRCGLLLEFRRERWRGKLQTADS
jgi:hypothetical protein